MAELVFRPDDRAPLELVFGDDAGAGSAPEYTLTGGGQVTGLRRASADLSYDINVVRPLLALRRTRWQDGQLASRAVRSSWQDAGKLTNATRVVSEVGLPISHVARSVWQDSKPLSNVVRTVQQNGVPLTQISRVAFEQARELSLATRTRFQPGRPLAPIVRSGFQQTIRLAPVIRSSFQPGVHLVNAVHASMQPGRPLLRVWRPHFQDGRYPLPGGLPPVPQPPNRDDWCYIPVDPIEMRFGADGRAPLELLFECDRHDPPGPGPSAPLIILPARYYMAVHSLTAHILPGLTQIPIFEANFSADVGSFGWAINASGPVDLFDALAPSSGLPAQIRITLDGISFAFLVDGLQHEERFGRRGVRISGRSPTALLAAPYARESTRLSTDARTAQQLALDALEFTGADLDWGLTDWLVPAGAWSHMGTPLAAVQAIVGAAGGYVLSARNAGTLLARHPYPELPGGISGGPWNWDGAFAADVELAPDALFVTSIERRDGPDFNAVYVSGTTQGVNAWVRRELSAGEKLAQPIADPLITANEAARQRGLSIVGAAGPKHIVQIEMPILTGLGQPGVLDVGQLVQINHASPWRGRVRSVSVNARMPKARQTVSLERHLETV